MLNKVAKYSFHACSYWCDSACTQRFEIANMASIQWSFYLHNAHTIFKIEHSVLMVLSFITKVCCTKHQCKEPSNSQIFLCNRKSPNWMWNSFLRNKPISGEQHARISWKFGTKTLRQIRNESIEKKLNFNRAWKISRYSKKKLQIEFGIKAFLQIRLSLENHLLEFHRNLTQKHLRKKETTSV